MKTRIMLFLVLLLSLGVGSLLAQSEQKKFPKAIGYMNDFANILTAEQVKIIDDKLRAYDQQTSLQYVVVIFKTINGADPEQFTTALGREWGVGQADIDNGLVTMIAYDDRKYFTVTGYGMEGDLPDGLLGSIQRETIVPAMQAGKPFDAVNNTVDAIIKKLGNAPNEQRLAALAEKQEQKRLAHEANVKTVSIIVYLLACGLFIIAGLWVLYKLLKSIIWYFQERARLKKLRKELTKRFADAVSTVSVSHSRFQKVYEDCKAKLIHPPDQAEMEEIFLNSEARKSHNASDGADILDLIADYPDDAGEAIDSFEEVGFDSLTQHLNELMEKQDQATDDAPKAVEEIRLAVYDCDSRLQAIAKRGFRIDPKELLIEAYASVDLAKKALTTDNDPVEAMILCKEATEVMQQATGTVQGLVDARASNSKAIRALRSELASIQTLLDTDSMEKFVELKKYPREIWIDIHNKRHLLQSAIDEHSAQLDKIEKMNDFDEQEFVKASQLLAELDTAVDNLRTTVRLPETTLHNVQAMRTLCVKLHESLKKDLAKPHEEFKDGDVGDDARDLLAKARRKFAELKDVDFEDVYLNWPHILQTLQQASSLLESGTKEVADDERKAEADRLAETRAAESRSRRSSYPDTSFTPSSPSSSYNSGGFSGGGFGGFSGGGGSFGGGGAGGGW